MTHSVTHVTLDNDAATSMIRREYVRWEEDVFSLTNCKLINVSF